MEKQKVYWVGDVDDCDGCQRPLKDQHSISDIRSNRGSWGLFCDQCVPFWSANPYDHYGLGLGQRYVKQADGRWLKVEG